MLSTLLCFVLLLYGVPELTIAANKKCFKLTADIVFALDSSFSIRSNDYHRQISFLKAVIDQFIINDNHIQVGVVSFGSSVRPDIKLNDFTTKRDLKEAVGKIQQMEGGTQTYKAIHFIRTVMYKPENGGRPWSKKQLVLITDGLSSNSSLTLLEASIAKSIGIEVFSILVGEGFEDLEIRGVPSEPKELHIFRVQNYKALLGIEHSLSNAACQRSFDVSAQGHRKNETDTHDDDEYNNSSLVAFTDCVRNTADVIFLMDSSSSIWEPDFKRQIKFVEQVTSRFDLGQHAIRVGVVVYSDAPITLLDLSEEQTHQQVHHALSKAPHITGGTNTALAINHVRTSFQTNGADRPNAARVIIILSDGQSRDMKQTILEAKQAHDEDVSIFAIGIGNETKASELMALASDPDDQFVFHVSDYQALSEVAELLAVKTCNVASPVLEQAGCPSLPTDVVFVYDTTSLSRHHHDYVINIISEVTQSKRLNHDLRVGVMREASTDSSLVLHDIELTSQWNQSHFKTRLDPGSRTASVDLLLRKARRKYFHPTIQLDHLSHKRRIVLFLDSVLENRYGATVEAIRLRRSHVNIAVVILGKHTDMMEVKGLASTPYSHNIIKSPSLQTRKRRSLVSTIISMLCQ